MDWILLVLLVKTLSGEILDRQQYYFHGSDAQSRCTRKAVEESTRIKSDRYVIVASCFEVRR